MKTIEENKKIIDEYPFLRSMWWDRDTQSYKWNYKTTVLDDVPKGWEDLILCMAEDIKPLLEESGQLNDFFTEQVKEKFGGLRFYHNCKCPKEVNEIIHDYAILSENICIGCGKPDALIIPIGWTLPWCRDCYEDKELWDKLYKESEIEDRTLATERSWKVWDFGKDNPVIHTRVISDKAQKIRKRYEERINK